jgi:hypothetical protein
VGGGRVMEAVAVLAGVVLSVIVAPLFLLSL